MGQGRVIKISLVGAICVLIILIAVIVGGIVLPINLNKNKDDESDTVKNNAEAQLYMQFVA